MQQIDWDRLGLKGESKQTSFETVCMFLCCRELKISKIESYQNQPGIETEPFEVNNKKYGFQAKFFESKYDWKQIEKSLNIAIETYPQLDSIFIYTNKEKTRGYQKDGKTKIETDIESNANDQNIKIEYVTDKDILLKLSQPSNLDLAQLYFGIGNELTFIKNSVNPKLLTFIQSTEYLDLPIINKEKTEVKFVEEILQINDTNTFLLTGNPGSGKSILMHALLMSLGGLDKLCEQEMINVLYSSRIS